MPRHLAIDEAFLRRFAKPRLAPKAIAPLAPKPCFLSQMGRQESSSPLAGLDIKSGRFSLCLDAFSCCGGQGQRFDNSKTPGIYLCELRQRMARLAVLGEDIGQAWQLPALQVKKILWQQAEKLWLGQIWQRFEKPSGRVFALQHFARNTQDSLLWPFALICIWQYGLKLGLIDFSRPLSIDRRLSEFQHDSPDLILVEGVSELHRPHAALSFESLVKFSYDSQISLIVGFRIGDLIGHAAGNSAQGPSSPRGSAFAQRLNKIKKRHPLEQVDPGSLMKWRELYNPANLHGPLELVDCFSP